MKNRGRRVRDKDPGQVLNRCCSQVIQVILLGLKILNDVDKYSNEEIKHSKSEVSLAKRLHAESFDAFMALKKNLVSWNLLDTAVKEEVENYLRLYCSVTHRFFDSHDCRISHLSSKFGFVPAEESHNPVIGAAAHGPINSTISAVLSELIPPPNFLSGRESIANRIEQILVSTSKFPAHTRVFLFGSSRNGFGSTNSDLDMCLLLGDGAILNDDEKRAMVELIGSILRDAGMKEIEIRSTARIPLILFKDPISNLDCDLSLRNALALSNTDLLLTYSCIDSRVRSLAYIIKKWAKQRHLNSPGDGTLSSYGFILCVIHYLQNIPIPILPNLQMLPPDWNGETMIGEVARPSEFQLSAADNTPCNTYFLRPTEQQFMMLQSKAQLNKQSIAELLEGFFEYYSWKFDYRRDIVSISTNIRATHPFRHNRKIQKAEEDCWPMHERLRYDHNVTAYCFNSYLVLKTLLKLSMMLLMY